MSRARVAVLKVTTHQLSVTAAAAEYGDSRRQLHRLLARYAEGGLKCGRLGPDREARGVPSSRTVAESRRAV